MSARRNKIIVGLLLGWLLILSLNSHSASASDNKWVPGEIIVKFKDNVPDEQIAHINKRHQTQVLYSSPFAHFKRIKIPPAKTEKQMAAIFKRLPDVEYAELNYYAHLLAIPNDPLYSYQWHFNDPVGGINVEEAWDITTGDPNVIVAVIDTGVAYETRAAYMLAPDLAQTNFVPGYNFVRNNTQPNDDDGHGTHVTGTIAQSTNNNLGVVGIAYNCSIMPIKVLDKKGTAPYTAVADGIYFAVANDANIINLSLSGPFDSETLRLAVAQAYTQGVTVICAAGNEYLIGNAVQYPAAYDEYCIAVGATNLIRERAPYSNTGAYIDIVAPGGDSNDYNFDTYIDGVLQQTFGLNPKDIGYFFMTGTSMAAPHISGIAALLVSLGINDPDQIRQALQNTAVDLGLPGPDNEFGFGLVAPAALNYFNIPGDLNRDHSVDLMDLNFIATHWLQPEPPGTPVPYPDGIINFHDFAFFAENYN